jgi:hypothetical protein
MLLFDTRIDMIRSIVPSGSVCAEIGVFEGTFSKQIYEALRPSRLYLIDLFEGHCDSGNEDGNNVVIRNLSDAYVRLLSEMRSNPKVQLLKGRSADILASFPDNSLDMIYIDGDHSYEGCAKDLAVSYAKVRNGGWILGHDYEMNMAKARNYYHFGVKQAVDEFCARMNQTIVAKGMDGCVSFAIRLYK